ncbi:glycolate oxidase subunit GlcE [soil metagenome]
MTIQSTGSDVALIADRIRAARARGVPLRIVSRGHWLDAGWPCSASERLDLSALDGIVSYEPGDLTLTARAGTSLSEIERVTATEGQWLTLDPHGSSDGSIGATIATASSGPLASAYGTPRDHVLGCEFVTGAGDIVRAGGRVVKNVAGFDLVRLVTGSWGTLGALTEMTVRLRARPEVDISLFVRVEGASEEAMASTAWQWTRESDYRPLAAELLSPSLARALGTDGDAQLLVRLGGNAAFVRAARDSAASVGDVLKVAPQVWNVLRTAEPGGAIVFRASTLPSKAGALFATLASLTEQFGGYAHAALSRGIVRCVIPPLDDPRAVDELLASLGRTAVSSTIVGERMPPAFWMRLFKATDAAPLAERVRQTFDPDRVLNPSLTGAV